MNRDQEVLCYPVPMNAQAGVSETYAPYRFRWDDVLRMVETGILAQDARIELIEGELIEVSPESLPHAQTKWWLSRVLSRELDLAWTVATDSPAVLSATSAPEPDVYVFPAAVSARELQGSDIVLAIEVAVSSLAFDLTDKARLYASHGVREYWVVDVYARQVTVHRAPGPDGYAEVETFGDSASATIAAIPAFSLPISGLPKVD